MSSAVAFDHFDDIDAQAEQLVGFDQHYQQLEPGPYAGAFLTCEAGRISVAVERTNRTLYQQGSGPAGMISALLLLRDGQRRTSRVNGGPLTTDHIMLLGEGASFDATIEAGAVPAVVSIPVTRQDTASIDWRDVTTGNARSLVAPELASRFRSVAEAAADGEPATITELSGSALMAVALSSPSERRSNVAVFRRACSMLIDDHAAQRSIAAVARSVGVSRRTLDDTFKAHVGVTPARFRKVLRLNRARRLIETGQHSVTVAASLSGLHHLGRFSQDYNGLFGELPSVALKRARMRTG